MTNSAIQQQASKTTTYDADLKHSSATFAVRHMMIATVRGSLGIVHASVEHDPADPRATRIDAVLSIASINTGAADRDAHLRSADFFDSATYPEMTFRSTLVEPQADDGYTVHGDLTIRGATHPVTLKVEKTGVAKDPWGNEKIALVATTTIDRTKWGLTWNQALEAGGVLVSEKVKIELDIQLAKRK